MILTVPCYKKVFSLNSLPETRKIPHTRFMILTVPCYKKVFPTRTSSHCYDFDCPMLQKSVPKAYLLSLLVLFFGWGLGGGRGEGGGHALLQGVPLGHGPPRGLQHLLPVVPPGAHHRGPHHDGPQQLISAQPAEGGGGEKFSFVNPLRTKFFPSSFFGT